jgi:hypothetical protein
MSLSTLDGRLLFSSGLPAAPEEPGDWRRTAEASAAWHEGQAASRPSWTLWWVAPRVAPPNHADVTARKGYSVDHQTVPDAAPHLLTLDEAAAFLRTPVATLRSWRHLGVGPDGFRVGRRVMYRREDVNRWLSDQQQAQSSRG